MIDDPELWALFRAEAEEHLQLLDSGLLQLESDASDRATLENVFRSAHSLKGAARMMGAHEVERDAHNFEDALMGAARHGNALEEATIERLYRELDTLRHNVEISLDPNRRGKAAPEETPELHLTESAPAQATSGEEIPEKEIPGAKISEEEVFSESAGVEPASGHIETAPKLMSERPEVSGALGRTYESGVALENRGIEVSGGGALAPWKIETMRVDTARLDSLLSMAGELVVSTKRAASARSEFEQVQSLREEVQKLSLTQKRVLRTLEGALGADASGLRELERLLEGLNLRWEAMNAVTARLQSAHDDMERLQSVVGELEEAIRGVRLLPLSTLFGQFPRSVRDLVRLQNKEVNFAMEGGETAADKRVLEGLKDPLMHMIRNAIDHGIETPAERLERGKDRVANLCLRGLQTATHVVIELEDDGRGLDIAAIGASAVRKGLALPEEVAAMTPRQIEELIFAPGFSTAAQLTDVSGRGVGLDVVRDNIQRLRGTVEVISRSGQGCIFRLTVPLTLATTRVLLVRAANQTFALPIESIASVLLLQQEASYPLRSRPSFSHGGEPIPTSHLNALLGLGEETPQNEWPCVVVRARGEQLGLRVDAVIEEQEIILKPLHATLENLRHIAGATILGTGAVCLLLAPDELIHIATRQSWNPREASVPALDAAPQVAARPTELLLVEDSIVTRTQEKRILESAGYVVTTAVDGLDAWQKLHAGEFDAIVSDIEMPNLDGIALAQRVREQEKYEELPIILVTSLASEADRKRGLEAGANAYITKGDFDQKLLLETLRMLI